MPPLTFSEIAKFFGKRLTNKRRRVILYNKSKTGGNQL
nr:MAG TPA: hypothetical protein [Caudoviricetes sp.]